MFNTVHITLYWKLSQQTTCCIISCFEV